MPINFPVKDPATGQIHDEPHYEAEEVAALFHIGAWTVRRKWRDGEWPFLRIYRTGYMSAADIDAVLDRSHHGGAITEPEPARLGVPVPPETLDGVTRP